MTKTSPIIHVFCRVAPNSWRSLATAERAGVKYTTDHSARSLEELRAMTWDQLKDGNDANEPEVPGLPRPPLFRPAVDGWVMPRNYNDIYASGSLLSTTLPESTDPGHQKTGRLQRSCLRIG
jgi:hypothetical protein